MPHEPGYAPALKRTLHAEESGELPAKFHTPNRKGQLTTAVIGIGGPSVSGQIPGDHQDAYLALEDDTRPPPVAIAAARSGNWLNRETLHEVFLNPGIFLLFAGIAIGFIGRLQGTKVTASDDPLFITLFHGIFCIFLLEMGITACSKLRDLGTAGWPFVAFALIAPNIFATTGILIAHGYSIFLGQPFDIGTYLLFAVLCGASSYIAVPAVQRLAIPEASPTLPLAASLGCTFSYNVTVGIPVYILIATAISRLIPVGLSI